MSPQSLRQFPVKRHSVTSVGGSSRWNQSRACDICHRVMKTPYTYRLVRLNHFAPEQMGAAVSHGAFDFFLLEGVSHEFLHEHRDYGGLALDDMQFRFGAWVRGPFRSDRICIGFFRELVCPCWNNGFTVNTTDLQIYAESTDLACRIYPHSRCAVVQVSRSALESAAKRHLGQAVALPAHGMVNHHVGEEARRDVSEAFDLCCNLLEKGGQTADQGVEIFLQTLVRAIRGASCPLAKQDDRRGLHAMQMVKLAELYLAAHLSDGYSSEEFARAVGLSERSLELQFKKIFGMSPKKWRQYMGLNIAYRKLGRGAERTGMVAEVAAACGFSHPGRFSAVYRELFGELPVRTRKHERCVVDQQGSIFRSFVH